MEGLLFSGVLLLMLLLLVGLIRGPRDQSESRLGIFDYIEDRVDGRGPNG